MPLSEDEEFELLSLERERGGAPAGGMTPSVGAPTRAAPGTMGRIIDRHPAIGAGETALAIGSGTAGSALGGLAGLAGAALPGPQGQGANWAQAIQQAMTYQPRTTAGQKMTEVAGAPFELLARGADVVGARTAEATGSPALGAGANAAIQAVPMLIPWGVKKAGRAVDEARAGRAAEAMFDDTQPAPVMPAAGGPNLLERGARNIMQRAVKPSAKHLRSGEAEQAIGTMLEKGISPTKGGMEGVAKKIDALDDVLDRVIANSEKNVDVHVAANEIRGLVREKMMQVASKDDLAVLFKTVDDFLTNPVVMRYAEGKIPVQIAQEMKRGTYRSLGSKSYGEMKGAEVEAQKSLARGLKNEIGEAEPAAARLNAQMSPLLNVQEVAGPRVQMQGNKNLLGLGSLSPSALNALVWILDRSPWAMGLAARGLYNARNAPAGAVNAAQYGTIPGVAQESAEEAAKR